MGPRPGSKLTLRRGALRSKRPRCTDPEARRIFGALREVVRGVAARPTRLEVAAPYLEVWEQDAQHPDLYLFRDETLTDDALRRRADSAPGLTMVRLTQSRDPCSTIDKDFLKTLC